jgi:hypothetical protein
MCAAHAPMVPLLPLGKRLMPRREKPFEKQAGVWEETRSDNSEEGMGGAGTGGRVRACAGCR